MKKPRCPYDRNGNLRRGGGRELTWTIENMPATIKGTDGITERYGYDASGARVLKVRGDVTTGYMAGLWEEEVQGSTRTLRYLFPFHGRTVATRTGGGALTYLHGDHLGSVSVATNAGGGVVERQESHHPKIVGSGQPPPALLLVEAGYSKARKEHPWEQ